MARKTRTTYTMDDVREAARKTYKVSLPQRQLASVDMKADHFVERCADSSRAAGRRATSISEDLLARVAYDSLTPFEEKTFWKKLERGR